jgi:hypothetical protein
VKVYHTESPTIKTKSKTFTVMDAILKKANKIIALDGDFADRSYDYFKSVNGDTDFTVIRNTMVPYVKTWKFTNDREKFDEKILKCLQNKQKIFICSRKVSFGPPKKSPIIYYIYNGFESWLINFFYPSPRWNHSTILYYSIF